MVVLTLRCLLLSLLLLQSGRDSLLATVAICLSLTLHA